jgi:hypothetical protein
LVRKLSFNVVNTVMASIDSQSSTSFDVLTPTCSLSQVSLHLDTSEQIQDGDNVVPCDDLALGHLLMARKLKRLREMKAASQTKRADEEVQCREIVPGGADE